MAMGGRISLTTISYEFKIFAVFCECDSEVGIAVFNSVELFVGRCAVDACVFTGRGERAIVAFLGDAMREPESFVAVPFLSEDVLDQMISQWDVIVPRLGVYASFFHADGSGFLIPFVFGHGSVYVSIRRSVAMFNFRRFATTFFHFHPVLLVRMVLR